MSMFYWCTGIWGKSSKTAILVRVSVLTENVVNLKLKNRVKSLQPLKGSGRKHLLGSRIMGNATSRGKSCIYVKTYVLCPRPMK